MLDSGANINVCNKLSYFTTYTPQRSKIDVVGNHAITHGVGTVKIYIKNVAIKPPLYDTLILTDVAYIPNSTNILSFRRLNKLGLQIDTEKLVLYSRQYKLKYKLKWVNDVMMLSNIVVRRNNNKLRQTAAAHQTDHLISSNPKMGMAILPSDSQEDIQFNPDKLGELAITHGPFTKWFELFRQKGNELLKDGFDNKEAFEHVWCEKAFYGNPKYIAEFIKRTLHKALEDFKVNPQQTKFLFIIPKWESAEWYQKYIPHFEIIKEYPKGTPEVFTIPKRTFHGENTVTAENGRAFLGPIPWPVVAVFKDIYTPIKINNLMLAHLRLGHINPAKV